MTESDAFVQAFLTLYGQVHEELREEVTVLDQGSLIRTLGPETNSISTLVVHLLGSEAEVLRIVRGLPSDRDRPSEFTAGIADRKDLLARIDAADRLLQELGSQLTAEDLEALRERPSSHRNHGPRTGLFWLMNSYGHAREHLAHLELTRQLMGREPS
jgi:hypothetical protein